ncbi:MAG: glycine/sarcosine/betaine reductase selenoprotein B family protein [Chloroflexi bacterium]|nr:glycine/sarcosine/betaine reductase selenoprotein B family protein [Chloroflexota bacterium]
MDVEELLKGVLAVTRDAAFNRVRYIGAMMSQEEQAEFLKGLFNQAVLAREARSGESLFDYLEAWEEKGMAIVAGRAQSPIELDATPWTSLRVPVREARLALVTTGGFYLKTQEPYETDGPENLGDWSWRAIPRTASPDDLEVAHIHYDLSGPREDRNCVFPIDRAAEMHAEGLIGSLNDTYYSFMGFIQKPDLLASETAPEVARLLKKDGVDAAVITAT